VTGTKTPASELTQRILVGAILIVVAVVEVWLGGTAFWILATVGGLIMMSEFAALLKVSDQHRRMAMYALCIPLGVISPLALGPSFFVLGLIAGMAIGVGMVARNAALGSGLLYVGLPILALLWLRDLPGNGLILTFWALSLVWATDIGAFFAGRAIGGPKIAPAISPSKTWAGLAGGMLAATILAASFHQWLDLPQALVWATPALAIAAQAGDFLESWMKRRAGVKDSGTLLPGHGGVLDRLDGLVTAAPLAALAVAAGLAA
jgi:phosphatidate cytidylyltransferase